MPRQTHLPVDGPPSGVVRLGDGDEAAREKVACEGVGADRDRGSGGSAEAMSAESRCTYRISV